MKSYHQRRSLKMTSSHRRPDRLTFKENNDEKVVDYLVSKWCVKKRLLPKELVSIIVSYAPLLQLDDVLAFARVDKESYKLTRDLLAPLVALLPWRITIEQSLDRATAAWVKIGWFHSSEENHIETRQSGRRAVVIEGKGGPMLEKIMSVGNRGPEIGLMLMKDQELLIPKKLASYDRTHHILAELEVGSLSPINNWLHLDIDQHRKIKSIIYGENYVMKIYQYKQCRDWNSWKETIWDM